MNELKDLPIKEKIKLADKILPNFMSDEDYKTFCQLVKRLEKLSQPEEKK